MPKGYPGTSNGISNTERSRRWRNGLSTAQYQELVRKDKNRKLKRKFGKTLEDKEAQYKSQEGNCAVCRNPLPLEISKCHWDHDHITGQLRGLAHSVCNLIVGFAEKQPEAYRAVPSYLEYWTAKRILEKYENEQKISKYADPKTA